MDYIEICEWDKFQHYKHRNPPWIKLYSKLLEDDDFDNMPDDSKLLFFCLLLFASRKNNKIKRNLVFLQKRLPIEKRITQKMLQPLIDTEFVKCYQDDSKPIDECKQNALPERETEKSREEQKINFLRAFNTARKLFPNTKRGNETEFDNFCKKHKDWRQVLPLLKEAVEKQIRWRAESNGEFRPPWKNFSVWINNRCWEDEVVVGATTICWKCDKPAKRHTMDPRVVDGKSIIYFCSDEHKPERKAHIR